jgi:hypothetical protein
VRRLFRLSPSKHRLRQSLANRLRPWRQHLLPLGSHRLPRMLRGKLHEPNFSVARPKSGSARQSAADRLNSISLRTETKGSFGQSQRSRLRADERLKSACKLWPESNLLQIPQIEWPKRTV